jgi:hypothetical protein
VSFPLVGEKRGSIIVDVHLLFRIVPRITERYSPVDDVDIHRQIYRLTGGRAFEGSDVHIVF